MKTSILFVSILIFAHGVATSRGAATTQPLVGPIVVLCATRSETDNLTLEMRVTHLRDERVEGWSFLNGKVGGVPVIVGMTGVGKVNAACAAVLSIQHYRPGAIIMVGIAGGVDPKVHRGDVVVGAATVQHDMGVITDGGWLSKPIESPIDMAAEPEHFPASPQLLDFAKATTKPTEFQICFGTIATGDTFIASSDEKNAIQQRFSDVSAVDMESAAVAQVCWQENIPFLAIRGISDHADAHAPTAVHKSASSAARNAAWVAMQVAKQYSAATSQPWVEK